MYDRIYPSGVLHSNREEPSVVDGIDRQTRWEQMLQHLRGKGVGEDQGMREEGVDRERVTAQAIEHQCTFSTVSRPQSMERSRASHSVDSPGGGSMKLRSTTTAPYCALLRTAAIRRYP